MAYLVALLLLIASPAWASFNPISTTTVGTVTQTLVTATVVQATLGSDQTISTSTWTKVRLTSETIDTDGYFDPSTNFRFTPLKAGKYYVDANLFIEFGSTAGLYYLGIYKNGTVINALTSRRYLLGTISGGGEMHHISGVVSLNGSTDYVEVYARQDSLIDVLIRNVAYGGGFQAYYLGP